MRRAEYVEPEKRSKQTCQSQFKLGASGALLWKNTHELRSVGSVDN